MGLRNTSVLCLALMLSFSSAINCLDITKILGQYPELSTFSNYLTETKLAEQINSGKAVTILALDNKAIASLSGKPLDAIKAVIGTHVIPEFYDEKKLFDIIGSHAQLPTLSTAPGLAAKIYVSLINEGEMAFSSAVEGSTFDATLVQSTEAEPGVVSILQVSQPIVKVGASASATPATPSKPATPAAVSTSSAGEAATPAAVPKSGAGEVASPSVVIAESPNSIAGSPESVGDAPAPAPSASSRATFGFIGAVIAFASIFVSL